VTPTRSASTPAAEPAGWSASWGRFWFTPADPVGLHAVRVGAGLLFLCWLLPLAGQLDAFFGLQGWFDRQAYSDVTRLPLGPQQPIGWSALYLCGNNALLLHAAYWLAVGVIVLFTLGLWPRLTGVLTWLAVLSFAASPAIAFDADTLLVILAFYLMLGYLFLDVRQRGLSWAGRLLGPGDTFVLRRWLRREPAEREPSIAANVVLRLLQLHVAIILVTSGLHKLQFGDWWAGVALWYPLFPPLSTTLAQVQVHRGAGEVYLWVLSLSAYAVLVWQVGFPLFAWRPRWRVVLLGGAVLGWLGAAFLYRLPLFGPAITIGCLSFLSAAEWHGLFAFLGRLPGIERLAALPPGRSPQPAVVDPPKVPAPSLVTGGHR
jgi:hypothetical protein